MRVPGEGVVLPVSKCLRRCAPQTVPTPIQLHTIQQQACSREGEGKKRQVFAELVKRNGTG